MNKNMLKRSVINVRMLIVVLVTLFIVFYELFYNSTIWYFGLKNYDVNIVYQIETLMKLSVYVPLASIFPGIAYGFSIMEERNSGFLKTELTRINKKNYIRKKVFYAGFSGMVSTLLPYIIIVIVCYAIGCTPSTPANRGFQFQNWMWTKYMYIWGGFFFVLCQGILFALNGIFWALFSMLISLVIRNRYIAYIIPYIFDNITEIIGRQVYIHKHQTHYIPHFFLKAGFTADTWVGKVYVIYIIYIVLLAVAIYRVFITQCRNGNI